MLFLTMYARYLLAEASRQYRFYCFIAARTLRLTDPWGLPLPILFAAEDEGRTEDPTERKRQREREKGRVPKSPEIPAALVTVGGLLVFFFLGKWMLGGMLDIMRYFLGNFATMDPNPDKESMRLLLIALTQKTGVILGPILIMGAVMAIVGNVSQVGFMFTLKPLQPDFSRIKFDFQTMVRKVFFSRQIAVNLVKTLVKVLLLGWVGYYIIYSDFVTLMKLSSVGVAESLRILGFISFKLLLILTLVLVAMSIPDYLFQRFEFTESIKMTKEEVKQESKEMEGDPLIKQRRRQKAYELYRRNMLREVKQADVIITNPTHYAVAVRYDPAQENAPKVLAKGVDHLALIIRNIARQNGVTIIENKPLARELYNTVPEGSEVPEQFYRVLIDIFMGIESIKQRLARRVG